MGGLMKKYTHVLFGNSDNMKYYALNGILFTLVSVLVRGYAIKFLDRLGGTAFHYSLFNALPGFVAIFTTLPGMLFLRNRRSKERTLRLFFHASRILPLFLAMVPFFPKAVQPMAFVLIYGIMNLPESIAVTAFQDYTGDVFSPGERADAFTTRNRLSQVAQITTSILVGLVLSISTDNQVVIRLYQFFIVLSFLVGLKEIGYMKRLTPLPSTEKEEAASRKAPVQRSVLQSVRKALSHREFQIFLMASVVFHFGWQTGWPLFNFYIIDTLGADEKWFTIISVTSSIFMVLSFSWWQRFIKTRGYSLAITFATLGMAVTPILYVLSFNLPMNTAFQLPTGFFVSGTIVVILGSLLESCDAEERLISIAIHATLTNITLAVAPLVGNLIQSAYSIQTALFVTAGLRLLGSAAFLARYLYQRRSRR